MAVHEKPAIQDLNKSTEFELPAKDLNFSVITENANNNTEEPYQNEPPANEQFNKAMTAFNNTPGVGNNIELWSMHDSQNDRQRDRKESDKENDDLKWMDLSDYNIQNFMSQYEVPSMNLNRNFPSNIYSQLFNQSDNELKNYYLQASKENIMSNPIQPPHLDKLGSSLLQTSEPMKLGHSQSQEAPEVHPSASLENEEKQLIHHSNSGQLNYRPSDKPPSVVVRSHSINPSIAGSTSPKQG